MTDQPQKPIATTADGAGMAQASTDHPEPVDGTKQNEADRESAEEEEAARLGDFA